MRRAFNLVMGLILLSSFPAVARAQSGVACPVTVAPDDAPATPSPTMWLHGTDALGVYLPRDGVWKGMGRAHHYRDKLFWHRDGYDGRLDPRPQLSVSGRRLDGRAPLVTVPNATNAHTDFGWTMLMLLEFPEAGCWQVTGEYEGATVDFVVRVGR